MRQVDPRVEDPDRDPPPVHAPGPEAGRAGGGDARLSGDGVCGPDRQLRVGLDRFTSGRAASTARALSSADSATALAIHSGRTCRTWPSRRSWASWASTGACARRPSCSICRTASRAEEPSGGMGLGARCTITAFIGTAAAAWAGISAAHASAITRMLRIRPSAAAGFRSARGSSRGVRSRGDTRGRSKGLT